MSHAFFTNFRLRFHSFLAWGVLGYTCLVMLGWIFHVPGLVHVAFRPVPMVFNTALMLACLSLASLLEDQGMKRGSRALSVFVLIFSSLVLSQYLLNFSWMDSLLVRPFFQTENTYVGRMAASTCVAVILAAVALFFNRSSLLCQYVRVICATLVFGFGLITVLGSVFGFDAAYGWADFTSMAFTTALCVILLAVVLFRSLQLRVWHEGIEVRSFAPFYILIVGILTSLLIWRLLVLMDYEKNRRITQIRAEALKAGLDNTFYPLETSLENMARRFALGKYKSYEMWAIDSEGYVDDFDSLKRMTWVDSRFVTRWVYPLTQDGKKLLGYNIYTSPDIHDVVAKVVETRQPALSNMIELRTGGRGFVLFTPIYKQDRLIGVLSTAILAEGFFKKVVHVDGYDLTILENGQELMSRGNPVSPASSDWTYRTHYNSLNANWEIVLTPTPAVIRENTSSVPFFVLIFGATISVLLSLATRFYQQARQAEKKVREVLDWQNAGRNSLSLFVISTDADFIIRDVNVATTEALGYSAEEMVGKSSFDFHDMAEIEANRKRFEEMIQRPLPTIRDYVEAMYTLGFHKALERTLIAKSGRRIVTEASSHQVRNEEGKVIGYLITFEDITQKKERERLMKEQEKLIMTSSRLASLGEMAAGIAHEINNPLTIISGYVSVLRKQLQQKGVRESEIDRRVDAIDATVQRIAKIIRGLRTYSRESHDGDYENVGLDMIVEDTLVFCQEKFRQEGIDLETKVEPSLRVSCRPYQISQVLVNLLNNARDAVQDSEVRKVEIQAVRVSDGVELSVTDTGPGIPPELREKIMQPFFTTKEVGRGIGLGLSISQGIIQGHSGKFYLDDKSAQTRFVIWLPIS